MEIDDAPSRPNDLLAALAAEDLDRLSRHELTARIAALEAEIARTRGRLERASDHIANADALFRR
ncbi:hypothetical protein GCM10011380_03730 [Sphingomonas metalli]|jgi:uncharacterized small protein (DUF1192 family)|uniref:DUF1192 domain-containing protein n=1 Tax=Sphingomonas metalli TaxID=1779358 RepID=A0A916WP97_9SPHN|nr:DUF1192 family protein [Sphingomonas metalli]GGB17465.1 hypothetical protein GCM10011380_03730 [Sphingomonas metalli]